MIRIIFSLCICTLFFSHLHAQQKSVLLESRTRQIAANELLPAQEPFNIRVPVGKNTAIIRIHVLKGNSTTDIVKNVYWIRPVDFSLDLAEIMVDAKLHGNSKYGFEVKIFNYLSDSEKIVLKETIHTHIQNYLDAVLEANGKKIVADKKAEKMLDDLNAIMRRSLYYYENTQQIRFDGYSDIVKMKLEEVQKARLSNAAYNMHGKIKDTSGATSGLKGSYASQLVEDLQRTIFHETDNFLNLDFVRLYDSFIINSKYTERGVTVLPLFIGYGGVYLGGNFGDLNYDSRAYAGVSIPLGSGNRNYFARTSFIMGVFLNNLRDASGKTFTGPIVNRPVFAGLGFRVLSFVHLNAGVVALSTDKLSLSDIKTSDIKLEPFIGLSAQFNLWLGFNKK